MHREVVDFSILTETGNGRTVSNFWGREQGEQARRQLGLDALDEAEADVIVKIPETVYSLTPSFFHGLFGDTLKKYGEDEKFFSKYKFDASSLVVSQVSHGANRFYAGQGAAGPA
ncbi:MAG: hypothetical protein ACYYKD_03465 [Rhodospirillales bacterium]